MTVVLIAGAWLIALSAGLLVMAGASWPIVAEVVIVDGATLGAYIFLLTAERDPK